MMRVGVLALQGASAPHLEAFAALGVAAVAVRRAEDLAALTHLVIPGGESTTIRHLIDLFGLEKPLVASFRAGTLAIFGTCAGAILISNDVAGQAPRRFGLLDATLARNAYGTQVDSFDAPLEVVADRLDDGNPLRGTFIRAPRILAVGPRVEVLATRDGEPVAIREGRAMAATFHPELSADLRLHRAFLAQGT
jgi:5'-phosphate synthase pdxT subunit